MSMDLTWQLLPSVFDQSKAIIYTPNPFFIKKDKSGFKLRLHGVTSGKPVSLVMLCYKDMITISGIDHISMFPLPVF